VHPAVTKAALFRIFPYPEDRADGPLRTTAASLIGASLIDHNPPNLKSVEPNRLNSTGSQEEAAMSRSQFSRLSLCVAVIGAVAITAFKVAPSLAAEDAVIIPAPAMDVQAASGFQTAVLAGGCFWGVQGVFQHTVGVVNAVSGYAGGNKSNADYNMVSTGTTGHAESVEIKYDPRKISYGKILQIFFSVAHDPTQLNRQGPDSGTQYRSAIFTTNDELKKIAEAYIAQLNAAKVYKKPIVTKVGPLEAFFPAEAYHQDYLTLHPNQPYIAYNDIPKVENLKKIFAENYTEKPTLVSARLTN
jgi:peptide-methionine (S)-S-oxide reductase